MSNVCVSLLSTSLRRQIFWSSWAPILQAQVPGGLEELFSVTALLIPVREIQETRYNTDPNALLHQGEQDSDLKLPFNQRKLCSVCNSEA